MAVVPCRVARAIVWLVLLAACAAETDDECARRVEVGTQHALVAGDERYCFLLDSPFEPGELAASIAPIAGRLTHHLMLYRARGDRPTECSVPANAELIATWSVGAPPLEMPEDVGLRVDDGEPGYFVLEAHYRTPLERAGEQVESGFSVCVAAEPRPRVAGIFSAGSAAFEIPPRTIGHEVSSECRQRLEVPLRVIAASAHMHERGRALRADVVGENGSARSMIAFDGYLYDYQRFERLDPEIELTPGARLRTTCVFDNRSESPIRYGVELDDEMCLLYLVVDPIDAFPAGRARLCY